MKFHSFYISFEQSLTGLFLSFVSILVPLQSFFLIMLGMIFLDFITGCMANYKLVTSKGEKWYFKSSKAWTTILKAGFSIIAVTACATIEQITFGSDFSYSACGLAAFISGTEFWSFLENASYISEHRVFSAAKKLVQYKALEKTGLEEEKAKEIIKELEGEDV